VGRRGLGCPDESTPDQPRLDDAFGELIKAGYAQHIDASSRVSFGGAGPPPVIEIVEHRDRGRMSGRLCILVRFRDQATDWFDYLLCSVAESADLTAESPRRIEEIDNAHQPKYVAVLRLVG
jgi:hypothetical protein